MFEINALLQKVYEAAVPDEQDLAALLSLRTGSDERELLAFADAVRRNFMGDGVILRGIIEFSNFCPNTCAYCGLNVNNQELGRYRLTKDEVLEGVQNIYTQKVKTVVLQSGDDQGFSASWLAGIIQEIKSTYGVAVTLSVGERPKDDYRLWREAGADRYLLKIETADEKLYGTLHPGMSFKNRLRCLEDLKALGYQTGSGIIVGLHGQTVLSIARDIIFLKRHDFDMISISPFIPHPDTPLATAPMAEVNLVMRVIALTRIVTRNAHMPATTALGSMAGQDHRPQGLQAGANVVMPNFTPAPYRKLYEIYPGKRCVEERPDLCTGCLEGMAAGIGRSIDLSRGDTRKDREVAHV
jgi:biotin synthase